MSHEMSAGPFPCQGLAPGQLQQGVKGSVDLVMRGLEDLKKSSFRSEARREAIRLIVQKTWSGYWLARENRRRSQWLQRDGGAGRVHRRWA